MNILLKAIGFVFVLLGIGVGVVSQMDYGNVLIGLNLGLAATLLVGGFIILGLGSVASAISGTVTTGGVSGSDKGVHKFEEPKSPSISPATIGAAAGATGVAAGTAIASQFDKAAEGVDNAIDKVAEAASQAKGKAEIGTEKIADVMGDAKDKITSLADDAGDKLQGARETVSEKVADLGEKISEKVDDVKDVKDEVLPPDLAVDVEPVVDELKADDEEPATDEPKEGNQEAKSETAEAGEGEEELYVVEELEIRGKQALVLSDGTVEAETKEGWMRFENTEHLEEYLDAMGG